MGCGSAAYEGWMVFSIVDFLVGDWRRVILFLSDDAVVIVVV